MISIKYNLYLFILFAMTFGVLSGYGQVFNKFIIFFTCIFSLALVLINLRISRKNLIVFSCFAIIASIGLHDIPNNYSSILYYLIFLISFFLFFNNRKIAPLNINVISLIIIFLSIYFCFIYLTLGKLYFFGIQPSISDMLLLSMYLYVLPIFLKKISLKGFFVIAVFIFYSSIVQSRTLLLAPIIYFSVFSFFTLLPRFSRYFLFLFISIACLFAFSGWYIFPAEIFEIKYSLAQVSSLAGESEAKRFLLLLNGWESLHYSNYMGSGYGPNSYLKTTPDNLLNITPQLLPLTIAVYTGIVASFIFCMGFFYWIIKSNIAEEIASKATFFSFILIHEYVFNPIFWLCILILSSSQENNETSNS